MTTGPAATAEAPPDAQALDDFIRDVLHLCDQVKDGPHRAHAQKVRLQARRWLDHMQRSRDDQREREHPIARASYDRWIIELFHATESAVPREALLRDFVHRFDDVHRDSRNEKGGPWALVLRRVEADDGYRVEGFAQTGMHTNAWSRFKSQLAEQTGDPTLRLIFEERQRIEQWYLPYFIGTDYRGVFDMIVGGRQPEGPNVWMSVQPLASEAGRVEHAVVLLYRNPNKLFDVSKPPSGSTQDLRALDVLATVYRQLDYQISNLAAFVERTRSEMLGQISPGLLAHEVLPGLEIIDGIGGDLSWDFDRTLEHYDLPGEIAVAPEKVASIRVHSKALVRTAQALMQLEKRGAVAPVVLYELCERVRTLLHVRCGRTGAAFENQVPQSEPIQSDDSLLLLLALNLCNNALDAMDESAPDGHARIVRLRLGPNENARFVNMEFANTGPPIAAYMRERIFERGYTTRAAGHGQGLYLVRMIAQYCGGDVALAPERCQSGENVCFVVRVARHLEVRETLGHVIVKR